MSGTDRRSLQDVASFVALRAVRLPDLTLRIAEAGPANGPLIVLLHGFPEFWWGWRHQIAPLAEAGYRVAIPDQRGYGFSDKPDGVGAYSLDRLAGDVIALADALGAKRIGLVGHDWGGMVAWWTVSRHPERISRLVILNAPHPAITRHYALRHPGQWLRSAYVGLFQLPRLPEVLLRRADFKLLADALRATSRPGTFTPEDLARYREAWARPGALTGMINWYRALLREPRGRPCLRIPVPTLVIWGRADPYLQPGLATASAALCNDVEVIWQDAGHWLHHEAPAVVADQMIHFLRR